MTAGSNLWLCVAVVALVVSVAAFSPGVTPIDATAAESAFAVDQALSNPSTLGLPVGATAPAIPGVEYAGWHTLVVVAARDAYDEYRMLLERWSGLPGLQIVLCWPESNALMREALALWSGLVTWVSEHDEAAVLAAFRVGEDQGMVTFLVDAGGTIVGRHSRFNLRDAATLDAAVALFAERGIVVDAYLKEQVLWYGSSVAYPDSPLEGLLGDDVWIRPGRPVMLLQCGCASEGQPGLTQNALADFPAAYPEVDFVWFSPYIPWEAYSDMWEYGRLMGMAERYPPYALPLDEYLAPHQVEYNEELAYVRRCMTERNRGWIPARDPGYRLSFTWLLQGTPMVAIVDAQGVVWFPPTFFGVERTSEDPEGVVDAQAVAELRAVLDEIVGR